MTPMYVEEAGREVEAAAACVSAAGSSLLLCPEAAEAVPPVLALSGVPCLADPSLDEALLLAASVDADVDAPLAGLPGLERARVAVACLKGRLVLSLTGGRPITCRGCGRLH